MKKITIIGYGELGRAIHKLLKIRKDLTIEAWDKKGGKDQETLNDAVFDADAVFVCVPSWCVRDVALNIKRSLTESAIVICLAKGIEEKTLKTMDVVLSDELSRTQSISILSGPMIAKELSSGKRGFAAAATKNTKDFKKIQSIFKGTNLTITRSSDFSGIALSGVLKNIYSFGLGIADGLELGNNAKGSLIVMAIKEMEKIIKILEGREKTVLSIAGLGDLIATGFSEYSRNRESGEELAQTGICCLESEGYRSLASIIKLLGNDTAGLPFLNALKSITIENKNPEDAFNDIQCLKMESH